MSTLKVDTITKADGTNSISQDAIITTSSPQLGRRNLIINGDFQVWQRGTSFTNVSNGTYAADRWVCLDGIGDVTTTWTKRTTSDPYTYIERTAGSATSWGHHQFIEMKEVLYPSGTKFTVSADVKHVSGTDDYCFGFHYRPNSTWGGATWNLTSTSQSVGTSGTRMTATFTTTSDVVSGDVCLKILPTATANGQKFGVKNVQVELGSVATPFEHRSYGEELALCQRYYWQGTVNGNGYGFVYGTTAQWPKGGSVSFPTTMRAYPTGTIVTSPSTTNCTVGVSNLSESPNGFFEHLIPTTNGMCRATNGEYAMDAEL